MNINTSKTIRQTIEDRHEKIESNFGGSDLAMAHMMDDSFSNIAGLLLTSYTPIRTTRLSETLTTIIPTATPRTVSPTIAPSVMTTPKVAILNTSVRPTTVQEVKAAVASTTATDTNTSSVPVMSGRGSGGGGGSAPTEESAENTAKVAEEKKYFGMTKKQGLIVLGVVAVGTLVYFKFYKKAF